MIPELRVTIEELVLDGFDREQGLAVAEAIRGSLERTLRDGPGALTEDVDHLDAGTVLLGTRRDPVADGSTIGRSLHAALTGGGRR